MLRFALNWWPDGELVKFLIRDDHQSLRTADERGRLPLHNYCKSLSAPTSLSATLGLSSVSVSSNSGDSGDSATHTRTSSSSWSSISPAASVPESSSSSLVSPTPPSSDVLKHLLQAYPRAAQTKDRRGWLPLHFLVLNPDATEKDFQRLIDVYPKALKSRTKDGLLPIELVMKNLDTSGGQSLDVLRLLIRANPQTLLQKNSRSGTYPLDAYMKYRFVQTRGTSLEPILADEECLASWNCLSGALWQYYHQVVDPLQLMQDQNTDFDIKFSPDSGNEEAYAFLPHALASLGEAGGRVSPALARVLPAEFWQRKNEAGHSPLDLALQAPRNDADCYGRALACVVAQLPEAQSVLDRKLANTLDRRPASWDTDTMFAQWVASLLDIYTPDKLLSPSNYNSDPSEAVDLSHASWLLHAAASCPELCPRIDFVDLVYRLFPAQTRVCDREGYTPLLCAIRAPVLPMQYSVIPQSRYYRGPGRPRIDADGHTEPQRHVHMVDRLLYLDPQSVVVPDEDGRTPLYHALVLSKPFRIVRLLVRANPAALEEESGNSSSRSHKESENDGFFPFQLAAIHAPDLDSVFTCLRENPGVLSRTR